MKLKLRPKLLVSLCVFLMMLISVQTAFARPEAPDREERLAGLCKVWGLLKYYHPEVAKGEIDWDAALINAIADVEAADDYDAYNTAINNLILEAGDVTNQEYNPGTDAHPNEQFFRWTKDNHVFNAEVRHKLKLLYKKHIPAANAHFGFDYEGGPVNFPNEDPYWSSLYPEKNYRILGLFRYWNAIQYFFPYKDIMDEDWHEVLEDFIPRFIDAATAPEYNLTVVELCAKLNDGHAFFSGYILRTQFIGQYYAPFEVRFIEGKTIVTRVFSDLLVSGNEIKVGDIIIGCRGKEIDDFREDMEKYAIGSNRDGLDRSINNFVEKGLEEMIPYRILRDGQEMDTVVKGFNSYSVIDESIQRQNSTKAKWKRLPGNIGYIDMEVLTGQDSLAAFPELMDTRALIIDMRTYPEHMWWYLTYFLVPNDINWVRIDRPSADYPGEFLDDNYMSTYWDDERETYQGKVIVLADEQTMSRAEFHVMAIQAAPDVTVIGSQTAGADGNVTYIVLPGGVYCYFTGLGIYYPDGSPTQRVGINIDIEVRPTVEGIQNGVDEVLERAIEFIEETAD